jgi:hypothetical protein
LEVLASMGKNVDWPQKACSLRVHEHCILRLHDVLPVGPFLVYIVSSFICNLNNFCWQYWGLNSGPRAC